MSIEQISREQLGWLGGVIDSEGYIYGDFYYTGFSKMRPDESRGRKVLRVYVAVSNGDPRLLREVSIIYKQIPTVGFYYTTTKKKDSKTWIVNIVTTGKPSTKKVLETVLDFLKSKRDQAETAIELIDYRESLGFLPSRGRKDKLEDDPLIQLYIERLKRLKYNHPSLPSETKRKANQILEF